MYLRSNKSLVSLDKVLCNFDIFYVCCKKYIQGFVTSEVNAILKPERKSMDF